MAAEAARLLATAGKFAVGLGTASFVVSEVLYDVPGGHRAVIFNRFAGGIQDDCIPEGMHAKIPFITYPKIIDVRTRPRVIQTHTGTKDLQTVTISVRVLTSPLPEKLPEIYQTLGEDFDFRVLPSLGNEVMKKVVAQYDAEQLLTDREHVSNDIEEELRDRMKEFNLLLHNVSITHLTYGKEFTMAIEQKQVAQQEAERAKFVVVKAEHEKTAAVIVAEGEAESAKMISDAIKKNGKALIEIRRIEAARDIAGQLARSRNITYLPSGNNMLLSVPP
jgi:prohibitin 1